MVPHRISHQIFLLIILNSFVIGGGVTASALGRRADDDSAELQLLFDPDLLKQQNTFTDEYGEMPPPLPQPPSAEDPYEPNLEAEYY